MAADPNLKDPDKAYTTDDIERRSPFLFSYNPDRQRNAFLSPIVSLFLPGFDQWWEGQYTYAAIYSGVALGGRLYADAADVVYLQSSHNDVNDNVPTSKDNLLRKIQLGKQLSLDAGFMSFYHGFRSAARTQRGTGNYAFLTKDEAPGELMEAPFHFQYLKRPSTYVPLIVVVALNSLALNYPRSGVQRVHLLPSDVAFTTAYSYNAGVNEEAAFRGALLPMIRNYVPYDEPSSILQAGAFALAHRGEISVPIAQFFFGWYTGDLSIKNNYTISEGVFIHTWWDVMSFLTAYEIQKTQNSSKLTTHALWLPAMEQHF